MATATKTAKGFKVSCPMCHDTDATVSLDLNNLADCHCSSCDETFSPRQARDLAAAQLAKWEAICRWVDVATANAAE